MKMGIFVHLFHVHHGVSQSHFVLFWNKWLHGLDLIFFVVRRGQIFVLRNKTLTYIFDDFFFVSPWAQIPYCPLQPVWI